MHIERPHLRSKVQVGPDDRLGDDPDIGLLGQAGLLRLLHDLLRFLLGAAVKMGQSQQQIPSIIWQVLFCMPNPGK